MNIQAKIDSLYIRREARLKLQREVDKQKAEEDSLLGEILVYVLEHPDETQGTVAEVTVKPTRKAVANDWPTIYAFIREHNDFSLLSKALTQSGVKAYWEEGKEVPGVVAIDDYSISIKGL